MGVVGRSLSGVARGQRALLEADDAVGDVRGVRVDRRHADRREVVREVAPRVELAVLGAVAAAFLVGGAPGEVRVISKYSRAARWSAASRRALVVVPGPGGGGAWTAGSCRTSPALPVSFELPGATR